METETKEVHDGNQRNSERYLARSAVYKLVLTWGSQPEQ